MTRKKLTLDVKPELEKTSETPTEIRERVQRGTLDEQARWMALADSALADSAPGDSALGEQSIAPDTLEVNEAAPVQRPDGSSEFPKRKRLSAKKPA